MLVIKLYVNLTQIDEIHVQNVSENDAHQVCMYKIRKPEGYEMITIYHLRRLGAIKLTEKIMGYLADEDYRSPRSFSSGLLSNQTLINDKLVSLLERWRDKHSCANHDIGDYSCALCKDTDDFLNDIRERGK